MWFIDLLKLLGDYGLVLIKYAVRATSVFLFGLGVVYIVSKMLRIVRKEKIKNIVATISMLIASFVITIVYYDTDSILRVIWETCIFTAIGSILYIIIGKTLHKRIDSLLDKKIGSD